MSMLVPINSITDLQAIAASVAQSKLFGVKTEHEAMALMLIAQAEGVHPAVAIQEFDIIEGKPARKTTALLARFQDMGGRVDWKVHTDNEVTGVFEYKGQKLEVQWTMQRAAGISYYNGKKQAMESLVNKFNWRNYPRAMLRARCIAEGIRAICPRAIGGLMVVEEAQDAIEPPQVVDMGAVEVVHVWTEALKKEAEEAALEGKYTDWWKRREEKWRLQAIQTEEHKHLKSIKPKE